MKDPNKHYVIVDIGQVEEYLLRGFARSTEDIREHLPPLAPDPGTLGLVLMETGKAAFEESQAPPVRYAVDRDFFTYLRGVSVAKLDVLAKDEESEHHTFVAKGDGATRVSTDEMFETRREAVAAAAPGIREEIEAHRDAADNLEAYLKEYDL
jgi:hypothetical protein